MPITLSNAEKGKGGGERITAEAIGIPFIDARLNHNTLK